MCYVCIIKILSLTHFECLYLKNTKGVFSPMTINYIYDPVGNMKTEARTGMGIYNDNTSSEYTYDRADKLTQTITTTKGVSVTNNYTHDIAGNITNDSIYTYSYDVGNRVILKQGNGERIRYNYDSDGNLVEEISNTGVKTYTYNSQNKLVRGQAENGDISAYIYNGLGVRVITEQLQDNINAVYQNAVFNNGSRFMTDYMPVLIDTRNVWQRSYETEVGTVVQNDPEFIRKEYITDYTSIANRDIMVYEEGSYIQRYVYGLNGERTSAEFSYYPETERTADLSNPGENPASDFAAVDIQKIYYFRNLLDSTMLAMDRNGDVISHVMYDEWGKPLTEPRLDHNFSGIKNINNYTGYTYDYILEIYFAQNRFYNPDTRQFTQQDPIKDGMNFYQYVGGNPLVFVDWFGLAKKASTTSAKSSATIVNSIKNVNAGKGTKQDYNAVLGYQVKPNDIKPHNVDVHIQLQDAQHTAGLKQQQEQDAKEVGALSAHAAKIGMVKGATKGFFIAMLPATMTMGPVLITATLISFTVDIAFQGIVEQVTVNLSPEDFKKYQKGELWGEILGMSVAISAIDKLYNWAYGVTTGCTGAAGEIVSSKTLTNQTGKVNNYVSGTQGIRAAEADFIALNPINIKVYPNGTTVGSLPGGMTANLHPSSSLGGTPTVEIYNTVTGLSTKIRY